MILIHNAQLINPEQGTVSDGSIFIENGLIEDILDNPHPDLSDFNDALIIDAKKLMLSPGFIDISVSLDGIQEKHLHTLSKAALNGGVTSVIIEPSHKLELNSPANCDHIINSAKAYSNIHLYVYAALIKDYQEISPIGLLKNAGVVGFSHGDNAIEDSLLLLRSLTYCTNHDMIATLYPEDIRLGENGIAHEGFLSSLYGLTPHPTEAELLGLERDLLLAYKAGTKLHIKQISDAQSLDVIKRYKDKLDLSVSCSLQHISLNEHDIIPYRTFLKMRPPLRTEKDRLALTQAVCEGVIDIITSTHRPCHDDVKRLPYDDADYGCSTIEHMLPMLLRLFYSQNDYNLAEILRSVTINPAKRFGLPSGRLSQGAPADIILFDPDQGYRISRNTMKASASNTPYENHLVQGGIKHAFINGKEVEL